MAKIRVALDAGHGYDTAGKRSYPFDKTVTHTYNGKTVTVEKGQHYREHEGNVGVCVYLEEELKRCGFDVYKSAWNDANAKDDKQLGKTPTDDVIARQKDIRTKNCDYSISIHFNAYHSRTGKWNSGQGCETLYHSVDTKVGDGEAMAKAIQAELKNAIVGQKNRGAKSGSGWGMCNSVGLGVKAAVICELAFMTNKKEAENYFCNPAAWEKYAIAICKGFCNYVGVEYVPKKVVVVSTSSSKKITIEPNDTVTIAKGAVYGGLGKARQKPVSRKYTNGRKFTVTKVQENNGVKEALIKELVSWVAVKYLTVVEADKVEYFAKYEGKKTSVVDVFKEMKLDSKFAYRSKVAKANNIKLYVGTAKQNNQLVTLAKKGLLIKP